jgi:hypothetical protein
MVIFFSCLLAYQLYFIKRVLVIALGLQYTFTTNLSLLLNNTTLLSGSESIRAVPILPFYFLWHCYSFPFYKLESPSKLSLLFWRNSYLLDQLRIINKKEPWSLFSRFVVSSVIDVYSILFYCRADKWPTIPAFSLW